MESATCALGIFHRDDYPALDVTPSANYERVGDVKCTSCSATYILWAEGKAEPSEVQAQKIWLEKAVRNMQGSS